MTVRLGVCGIVLMIAVGLAAPASAARRVFSYDSANPLTEQMTEAGLTFVFDKTLTGQRVQKLIETHDVGEADLIHASDSILGPGGLAAVLPPGSEERDLYEITNQENGASLRRALCPGSDRAFLAFGRLKPEQDLRVHAIGYDLAAHHAWLCLTLDYNFRGEWALAPPALPQPDRSDPFNDAPTNRRY